MPGVFAALLRRRRPPAEQDAAHAACFVYLLMFGARAARAQFLRSAVVGGLRYPPCAKLFVKGDATAITNFAAASSVAMSQIRP